MVWVCAPARGRAPSPGAEAPRTPWLLGGWGRVGPCSGLDGVRGSSRFPGRSLGSRLRCGAGERMGRSAPRVPQEWPGTNSGAGLPHQVSVSESEGGAPRWISLRGPAWPNAHVDRRELYAGRVGGGAGFGSAGVTRSRPSRTGSFCGDTDALPFPPYLAAAAGWLRGSLAGASLANPPEGPGAGFLRGSPFPLRI